MSKFFLTFCFSLIAICTAVNANADDSFVPTCPYPESWWKVVPKDQAYKWEITPQEASCEQGDVILSKRTELGVFSNFAAAVFILDGRTYASVEGFWQSLKYPENLVDGKPDLRWDNKVEWTYTREQVENLISYDAKKAGNLANDNMEKLGIRWLSYLGHRINYLDEEQDVHAKLIRRAIQAKVEQNPKIKELLLKTGGLVLKPDHKMAQDVPQAFKFFEILMSIRDDISAGAK